MSNSFVNAQALTEMAVFNQALPAEGPRAIPITLDFSVSDEYSLDYSQMVNRGFMSMIQAVYIDNSNSDLPVSINVSGSGQNVTVKGRTQGYYPLISPNPFRITMAQPGGGLVKMFLCNFPVAPGQWPTQ